MTRDQLDRAFEFPTPPRRVVSLVPSLTETLFEIGAGDSVVGATSFCIFPAEALRAIPKVGGTKNPKVEVIRELKPDLVYVNVEENLLRHAEAIKQFAPVFATHPKSVEDVIDLIVLLGSIHRREQPAAALAGKIREAIAQRPARHFTFACPIWKEPWMWCGGDTYVSDLVTHVGGSNVLAGEVRYPTHALDEVLALQPEVVFLPDEPYLFREDDAAMLRGAGVARVIGPFPGHLFTWHGARTLLGLRFLRERMVSSRRGIEDA